VPSKRALVVTDYTNGVGMFTLSKKYNVAINLIADWVREGCGRKKPHPVTEFAPRVVPKYYCEGCDQQVTFMPCVACAALRHLKTKR